MKTLYTSQRPCVKQLNLRCIFGSACPLTPRSNVPCTYLPSSYDRWFMSGVTFVALKSTFKVNYVTSDFVIFLRHHRAPTHVYKR